MRDNQTNEADPVTAIPPDYAATMLGIDRAELAEAIAAGMIRGHWLGTNGSAVLVGVDRADVLAYTPARRRGIRVHEPAPDYEPDASDPVLIPAVGNVMPSDLLRAASVLAGALLGDETAIAANVRAALRAARVDHLATALCEVTELTFTEKRKAALIDHVRSYIATQSKTIGGQRVRDLGRTPANSAPVLTQRLSPSTVQNMDSSRTY